MTNTTTATITTKATITTTPAMIITTTVTITTNAAMIITTHAATMTITTTMTITATTTTTTRLDILEEGEVTPPLPSPTFQFTSPSTISLIYISFGLSFVDTYSVEGEK